MSGAELRLLAPAALAWLTAAVLVARSDLAWWTASAAGVAALGALLWGLLAAGSGRGGDHAGARARRSRWRGVPGVLALSAAGIGLVASAVAGQAPARHPAELDRVLSGHSLTVEATVTSGAVLSQGSGFSPADRWAFHATASRIASGRVSVAARMPVLIFTDATGSPPALGSVLSVAATAKPGAPGDSIAAMLFASGMRVERPPGGLLALTDGLRAGFAAATARLPGSGGQLLPGLAIGDVSRVDAGLDASMKAASLSHLTAVSGSNCAVIVSGLIWLAGLCGLGRGGRAAVALAGLGGFVLLVTPGPSVLRAAVMATVLVVGQLGGRAGRGVSVLALAVVGLVVWNPWLGRDYGFALSVLATAGLLLLAPPLEQRLAHVMPAWLARGLAIPIAAQLACQPVLILLSPTLPLYGIVANVLAEPAAAPATVLGLLGCLAQPLMPAVATLLDRLAWLPAQWIAGVASTASTLPGNAVPWFGGWGGMLLATAGVVLMAVLVARGVGPRWRRVRAAAVVVALVGGVLGAAAAAGPVLARTIERPRAWTVGMCDVGQGDAILLRDGDAYGVIDTGPEPARLHACLKGLGIRRVDLLVLTHYDLDHVGGVDAVVGAVGTALVGPPDDASAQRRVDGLARGGAAVHVASRGDTGTLGALRWTVLWPAGGLDDLTSNERGVALQVEGRGIRMLFLADLDQQAQDAMLRLGEIGRFQIVKVAHHGSSDQSDRLYGLVGAQLGLISCGMGNDYGHPTAHVLDLLRAAGTAVARTDLEGTVLVSVRARATGPPALTLWSERHATQAALWTPARR